MAYRDTLLSLGLGGLDEAVAIVVALQIEEQMDRFAPLCNVLCYHPYGRSPEQLREGLEFLTEKPNLLVPWEGEPNATDTGDSLARALSVAFGRSEKRSER